MIFIRIWLVKLVSGRVLFVRFVCVIFDDFEGKFCCLFIFVCLIIKNIV